MFESGDQFQSKVTKKKYRLKILWKSAKVGKSEQKATVNYCLFEFKHIMKKWKNW